MNKVGISPKEREVIKEYCGLLCEPHSTEKFIGLVNLLTDNPWLPITSEVALSVLVSRRLLTNETLIESITKRVEGGLNRRL